VKNEGKKKVLFLCTGNSCRSQMAEGWARHLKGDTIEPYSAGVAPEGVNPRTVLVMAEAGVDIADQRSKHVDTLKNIPFDMVVTLCRQAGEQRPVLQGRVRRLHVGFDDPAVLARGARTEEEALGHYRRIRDAIKTFIDTLPESI
jgi:arsenate reductase